MHTKKRRPWNLVYVFFFGLLSGTSVFSSLSLFLATLALSLFSLSFAGYRGLGCVTFDGHLMMPRFSLGSYLPATSRQQHVQQEEQQQQQQPDTLKGWWTKLVDKFTTERDDFGDLSPDRPPLPFIASLGDAGTGSNIGRNLPPQASSSSSAPENSSGINRFTRAKRIAPQAEVAPVTHVSCTHFILHSEYNHLFPIYR